MKDQADYSQYECPYSHLEKECGHELKGPEGYQDTYGVWCACGFRGPVFCLDPILLNLRRKQEPKTGGECPTCKSKKKDEAVVRVASFEGGPLPCADSWHSTGKVEEKPTEADDEAAFEEWWSAYQASLGCAIQFDDDADNLEFIKAAYEAGRGEKS